MSKSDAFLRKKQLMQAIKRKEIHVRKLKAICKKRSGSVNAIKTLEDSPVVRCFFKGMSSATADFLISQLRCAKRSPNGRRWTTQEKVIALALFKRSPRCYNFLRKIVALLTKNRLLSMLQKVSFHASINEHMLKHISVFII